MSQNRHQYLPQHDIILIDCSLEVILADLPSLVFLGDHQAPPPSAQHGRVLLRLGLGRQSGLRDFRRGDLKGSGSATGGVLDLEPAAGACRRDDGYLA